MRDLMPFYRENILENEGLEPFSLNIQEMKDKLWKDGQNLKMPQEEFDFIQKYVDLIDEINNMPK